MSRPDDSTVPDTAMNTGSDDGEAGDRAPLDEGPLTDDENALLERLRDDERPDVVTDAPEDTLAAAEAVRDDAPLSDYAVPAGAPDDDTPPFRPPGQ